MDPLGKGPQRLAFDSLMKKRKYIGQKLAKIFQAKELRGVWKASS